MPPTVNDKTTPPAGALPQNLRLIVLGAIALLVVIASFFSGQSAKKASQSPVNVPAGPSPNQLSTFTQMLEKQRREMEAAKKQADALRLAQEQQTLLAQRAAPAYYGVPEAPRASSSPAVDPFEQKRREREETAPFASNIALRVAPAERGDQAARRPNPPPIGQEVPKIASEVRQGLHPEDSKNQGSGRFLPEKDNGLFRIYEGTFIEAKLINRLDGSFTGPVKCVVSKEVRSKSGDVLLIPKGSQVFGEAKRVDAAGQTRLAVSFKRLLLPNGYSVNLDNVPGLSEQGETGLKDKTNNHYLRTFGISGAVGLLGGLSLYSGRAGAAEYTNGVANAEGGSATTILNRYLNLLPTITIREGHEANVYLSSDLQLPEYRP